jgi:MHS family proline/betaine transporter-like MFS transporter
MIPLGGVLSDRFGRKRILSIGAAWLAFAAYPGVYLAATGTITGALLGQLLLVIGVGLYGGACFVAAPEFFPTAFRATGHAISYQVTVAIFGGTTPLIATLLVQAFGSPLAPAYYVALVAVACLVLIQFVPETRGVSLRTSASSTVGGEASGVIHELR